MPAKRSSKSGPKAGARSAETPDAQAADPVTPDDEPDATAGATESPEAASSAESDEPESDEPESDEPESDGAEPEAVPLNRAERRAKGKSRGQSGVSSRGKVVGSKGPVSSQRMWANRRSG